MSEIPHLRITRLKAKNFKSLADVDVTLESLTVLVGRNASGKSNILDALAFIGDALDVGLKSALDQREGISLMLSLGIPDDSVVSLGISIGGPDLKCDYEFGFHRKVNIGIVVDFERFIASNGSGKETFSFTRDEIVGFNSTYFDVPAWLLVANGLVLAQLASLSNTPVVPVLAFLSTMRFYDPVQEAMRAAPRAELRGELGRHLLQSNGENIPLALLTLTREQPELFQRRVIAPLQLVLPEIREITVQQVESFWFAGLQRGDGKNALELWQESHGTLRLLASLIALVPALNGQTLVALEEPEDGVHPAAAGVLADAIVEASLSQQIVITTHSPDLLDHFPAESIRIVEQTDGWTRVGQLAGDQFDAVRRHLFHAGELMRMEGLRMPEERPPEQDR